MHYFFQSLSCRCLSEGTLRSPLLASKLFSKSLLVVSVSLMAVSCSATPEVSSDIAIADDGSRIANEQVENELIESEASEIESDADKTARNRRVALISKLSDNPTPAEMRDALAEVEAEFGTPNEPYSDDSSTASEASDERGPKIDESLWLEADATYSEQNFSDRLYAEILETDSYCLSTGTCGDVRYLFKDMLLVSTVGDFGSTETSLIPYQRISKSQALSYAQILDIDSMIDFENDALMEEGESQGPFSVTETYFEADLSADGAAYELASARMVQIVSDQNGVFEVSYRVEVF